MCNLQRHRGEPPPPADNETLTRKLEHYIFIIAAGAGLYRRVFTSRLSGGNFRPFIRYSSACIYYLCAKPRGGRCECRRSRGFYTLSILPVYGSLHIQNTPFRLSPRESSKITLSTRIWANGERERERSRVCVAPRKRRWRAGRRVTGLQGGQREPR